MDIAVSTDRQYRYGRVEYKFERDLDGVQGREIQANMQAQARTVEMARLKMIERRVHARMSAEAHDRVGKSMFLAAQIRKAGYTAKRQAVPILRKLARDFDERTFELFRLGWLDKLPATCERYVAKVLDQRIAELDTAEKNKRMVRLTPCTGQGLSMLSELKDVITALTVNRRGYVTMKVRTTRQKSQVVIFRASSASEIAFPPTIDSAQVTTTKSKIITELALDYGLQPMWANPDGTEIRFGLLKWFPELAPVAI